MIWIGRVNTLYIDHNTVKCQYHKCLGLRNHFCLKKSEIQPCCLSWTQTADKMSHMIWLIVTRWIGLLRLYNFLDPEKGICDKLCSKTGKESPHCSGCHGECDSVSILSVIVNNSYLKNSAMNIELWCLRKLFNNEFFWSWLTNTNNKKSKFNIFFRKFQWEPGLSQKKSET